MVNTIKYSKNKKKQQPRNNYSILPAVKASNQSDL